MRVVVGTVGANLQFYDESSISATKPDVAGTHRHTKSTNSQELVGKLAADVKSLLMQSIALNATAFEGENGQSFVGSSTESALLNFARDHLGMGPVRIERSNEKITQLIPFSSMRQCMVTIIKLPKSKPKYRVFIKGASEVLLAKCPRLIQDPTKGCSSVDMSIQDRQALTETIESYANRALRTISLVYRDFYPHKPWRTEQHLRRPISPWNTSLKTSFP